MQRSATQVIEAAHVWHAVRQVGGMGLEAKRAPKLMDRVRQAIRVRHYSRRTEEAYVTWIRRFIVFHGKRHPSEVGAADISEFLTALAVHHHISASTQNQALCGVLFLYRDVLRIEVGHVAGVSGHPRRRASPSC